MTILWLRLDLRLADHPALRAALDRGAPVVPVYIHAPGEEEPWKPGAASRWWLHHSLVSIDAALRETGSRLIVRRGPSLETLRALAKELGATAVVWNRRYEPAIIARDARIKEALRADGLDVQSFNGALLHEPWTIRNSSRKPFQVFSAFWRYCLSQPEPDAPLPAPRQVRAPDSWPTTIPIESLELRPRIPWDKGLASTWEPGVRGALRNLRSFVEKSLPRYGLDRNRPDLHGTSRLSPHLHFGEISPRQIWHAVRRHSERLSGGPSVGPSGGTWRQGPYLAEIGWREFAHHLLFHWPGSTHEPLRPAFNRFPWRTDPERLEAWRRGQTGYPIVDAGMRELWTTGWMHNRVRMVVASFLVKDLMVDWREGAAWFWDTLVDADLAQNTLGWQWTAGCGADAAPYFRVFNPASQGEKFDPDGVYVRRWCPELSNLSDRWVHRPAEAPAEILSRAGVVLGRNYPEPIVDHAVAREKALEAFSKIQRRSDTNRKET